MEPMTAYEPGARVRLVRTTDMWTKLRPGALGTVTGTDDAGTVHVAWDSGSRLGVLTDAGDRIEPAP
jgi:Domain of unknown function (DUF4314)